jgi:hypothetical protein
MRIKEKEECMNNKKKEYPEINFLNKPKKISSRMHKRNPRALGTNPRSLGANPRSIKLNVQ